MDWIEKFILVLFLRLVSPASVNTTSKNEEYSTLHSSSGYQVTENVIDIPDNRTIPPIISNFAFVRPLNFGNNTVAFNNAVNNNNNAVNNNNEANINEGESSEEVDGKPKKTSFSIFHIKAEYDNKPVEIHQNVFSKVIGGFKDYVYHLKRGVVDGLHSYFHKDDDGLPQKKPGFHDKFHRTFEGVQDFGHDHDYDDDDDDSSEHFGHY